ncbi:MAG: RagB/SusD family nutrient uptake outer membrane protein [Candidatus Pseudobacter hemicellulosilyticus]|uniref:RagB/SusD family nutrient uptake outer membrane protein n=1 Tax=Candidatus Pseudobacter hemicellulosilyticus TaxID=3121375 RepID=A0AAJ6BJY0_9BACT|nr:MAG: RagB/SusD family nutrient uptake outer membrane protein [Pseudobacter sp.]
MKRAFIYSRFSMVLLCSFLLTGCDKYLDVTPKGYTLLKTVSHYDQWMNDPTLWLSFNSELNLLGDLVDLANIDVPPTAANDLLYLWTPQFAEDGSIWGKHYSIINYYNTVIAGVDDATGGTERQKANLKAEALLARAYEYFYLVNEYGKPYDSATAANDPGVPLVTSDDVAQIVPARSSVKEVYDFIIADINTALPNLPLDNSKNRYRGSAASAYSVLARIYLNVRSYSKAREYAVLALENSLGVSMMDYNQLSTAREMPLLSVRPDAIYARRSGTVGSRPTIEHLKSFNTLDRRLNLFYTDLGDYSFTRRSLSFYFPGGMVLTSIDGNNGTSIQEMKLIIAEAAARSNDLATALQQLNELRQHRLPASIYQPYDSEDPAFVLQKTLEERRFELPFSGGLRWLDIRRLDQEDRMPAVHRYDAQGNVIATLEPHSARYTLQVPVKVLTYNPGMEQNP